MLLSFVTLSAQGQLSLSDAIEIGLRENYDILIQDRNIDIAENNNAWGETGFVPTVALNLQSQNNIRNQQSDNQFFAGNLFPGFELNDQRAYGITPAAQVNWTIFQGNRAVISKRRLEQLEMESQQNADIVIANTIQSIILAYYIAVLERDRLDLFEQQMALSRDRYQYVQSKYDLGSAVSSDVLLEENNYLTDSSNYINQQLVYNTAIRNLNTLLVSDDLNVNYTFSDSLYYENVPYEYENLEDAMLSENVDLKQIFISQSILELQADQARADRYPTLTMGAGYQWNRNVSDLTSASYEGPNQDYQNPPEPLVSRSGTLFANFTLSFNLFNAGRINRAIKNSMVQVDIGNLQREQLEQSLTKSLNDAYDRYQVRNQLYGISERRQEAAEVNLDISDEKFKNGSINSFDYRVVQNNYLSASIQQLQALYNLMESKIELMRLTGGIIRTYNQ